MGQGQEGLQALTPHRDTICTREVLLRRGLWLEIGTVAWNAIEGIIAVAAGIVASSVALVGFGVDSFVETASGAVVGWRLRAELVGQLDKEYAEHLERRAGRIAGALLLGLSVYIVVDAGRRLLGFGPEAHESRVGMVLIAISAVVMPFLGWAKLRTATALGSGALRADAYETITCSWLSLTTFAGLILNAASGGGGLTRSRPSLSFRSRCERDLRIGEVSTTSQTEVRPNYRVRPANSTAGGWWCG